MKSCTSSVPGTCGELFQGSLDGIPCLVSCPVDRMARLRITEMPSGGVVCPPDMSKTKRALELALEAEPRRGKSLLVERLNALPEGKGYASSTADILAAVSGLAALSGEPFDPERATAAFASLRQRTQEAEAAVHKTIVDVSGRLPVETRERLTAPVARSRRP